jgi:hypothetical protein
VLRGVQPQEPYGPAEEAAALARNRELARGVTVEDVLPQATRRGPDGAVLEAGPAVDCGQVRHASSPHGASTLLVTTLELSAGWRRRTGPGSPPTASWSTPHRTASTSRRAGGAPRRSRSTTARPASRTA